VLKLVNNSLKAGALPFNASCNEQVFSPKPWKKISADSSCRFRAKRKKRTFHSEKSRHRAKGKPTL